MSDAGFNYGCRRYLPIEAEKVRDLFVKEGDFFVARGNGSLHLVGRGTLAQSPPDNIIFPDTMMRLQINRAIKATKWLSAIWSDVSVRRQIERKAKTTAGIWKLAQPDVSSIVLPLPPLKEQQRIVAEVDRRLSIVVEVETTVAADLKHAERLRQSIMQRAFSGKLVPQDPNDAPATVLLEQIRAEKTPDRRNAQPVLPM